MNCDLLQMGQTDTLLDFGQEEYIDFGQENNIPDRNLSELQTSADLLQCMEYQPFQWFWSIFKYTGKRYNTLHRFIFRRYKKNKIKALSCTKYVLLYRVVDVINAFAELGIHPAEHSPKYTHTPPNARDVILHHYMQGHTAKEVATAFRTSQRAVYTLKTREKQGVERERSCEIRKEVRAALKMYEQGHSFASIKQHTAIGKYTVRYWTRKFGITRAQKRIAPATKQAIVNQYKSGKPIKAICEYLHVCYTTVSATVSQFGLTSRCTRVTPRHIRKMISLFKKGMSISKISATVNINRTTVTKYLIEKGVHHPRSNNGTSFL